ncbi:DUF5050 domain-containing protein [Brevibacillus ginsengisoli]|uniref:DUF5050 domain-containing protein n=1 Tax=Brevibacillus ginsengisoli TaxID=363854 RepID=UPI003CEE1D32
MKKLVSVLVSFILLTLVLLPSLVSAADTTPLAENEVLKDPLITKEKAAISKELANIQGELNGNIINWGQVASNDKYHFYVKVNKSWSNTLYSYNLKTKKTKALITSKSIYNLIVVGDWIYYLGDAPDKKFHQAYSLYKIKIDGSKNTLVSKIADLTRFFYISDGWAYFSNWSDNEKLYKIKLDGTSLTKVSDIEVDGCILMWGDWLAFEADRMLQVYSKSGKELMKVNTRGRFFNVYDSTLYSSKFNGGIDKLELGSTTLKVDAIPVDKVLDYAEGEIDGLNFKGDFVYYFLNKDTKIIKQSRDGKNKSTFVNLPKGSEARNISIVGNWMYYEAIYMADGNPRVVKRELFRISLDVGSKAELVYKETY